MTREMVDVAHWPRLSGAMSGTKRQLEIRKTLRLLVPLISLADAQDVLARAGGPKMRALRPDAALWLALVSHIRHRFTDYDQLLDEGYERDAARFFVLDATNDVLARWGSTRVLRSEGEDETALVRQAQ
jgi:hypothetical protein